MKLMIIGSDQIFSIERFYVQYLRSQGVNVIQFCAHRIFAEYYQKSFLNRVLFRCGLSSIYASINKQFRGLVKNENPDIVWVFKGMELYPATLRWVKRLNIKLVNYNPDNPFIFSGRGSGNKNIRNSIGLYDLHFTYNLSVKKRIAKKFGLKTDLLPFGFDVSDALFLACSRQEEVVQVCFLGNPDLRRASFITGLAERNIGVAVYGHNWRDFVNHSAIKVYSAVYGDEQWMTLRRYRVQLNLMRNHNEDSHNMRSFEVPSIGGIMVAPDTVEHRMFFDDGKEIFLYRDLDHCVELVQYLLRMPRQDADKVRIAARQRCLRSGYSYTERAGHALKELEKLMD